MTDDLEVARLAIDRFLASDATALPECNYLLPELRALQNPRGSPDSIPFTEAFAIIDPDGTVQDAARVLGRCNRLSSPDTPESFVEALRLFCEVEARIRFSLWPGGVNAPHHFSKLLNTKKVQSIFSRREILAVLAIFADPKGLNLRNITAHGFSVDTSLTLPLLRGISGLILPKLSGYAPPVFDFAREQALLNFHKFRLDFPSSLAIVCGSKFSRFDARRSELLSRAYCLFADEHIIESLMILFPLFEHSLRRSAVAVLGLPTERLCASSEEHFLSIQECLDALPCALKKMVTDLLFAPDGPRLRDRLMHGNVAEIPKDFAFALFVLFEKCAQYFENLETDFFWDMAFHPSRNLEFELSLIVSVKHLDFMVVYDSESYERLIECLATVRMAIGTAFKDKAITTLLNGPFPRFIAICVMYFAAQSVKTASVKHLLALAYAPSKFGSVNDADRFRATVVARVKAIGGYLPFIGKGADCSYEEIEGLCANLRLLDDAMGFVETQIDLKRIRLGACEPI
jgi:hypothetical protein